MELIEFVDSSSDAQILIKVSDITQYLHKSFTELETITKNQMEEKNDIYIQPAFRPMNIDMTKIMEVVKKVEMIPIGKESFNTFELKFL